jgi:hypothetical protein
MDLSRSPVRFCLSSCVAALFVSVVACQDNPSRSVPPDSSTGDAADADLSTFPDTSMPQETGPADAPADGPLCSGHLPGYVPPTYHPTAMEGACSAADIAAYVTACSMDERGAMCDAWKADPKNATCEACVWRTDGSGPLRFYPDGTFASINESGCIGLAGSPACGAKMDASYYCLSDACGSCPLDGGQLTGACYETVAMGDCLSWNNAADTCESTLTGDVVNCEALQPYVANQLSVTLTLFCGTPGDGGPADDSGAADGSEASATDASQDASSDASQD